MMTLLIGWLAAFGVQPTVALPLAPTSAFVSLKSARPVIDLTPCILTGEVKAECGTLKVYENRAARSGRQIELRLAIIRATTNYARST